MFERFNDRSRRVIVVAQEEARALRHQHVGTEHLLLGLIHEEAGVLGSAGVTLESARTAVTEMLGQAPGDKPPAGYLPFTPRAKKALELALREALELRHKYIQPEHLLLGLIRDEDGVGALVLTRLAGPLPALREQVLAAARNIPSEPVAEEPGTRSFRAPGPVSRPVRSQLQSPGETGEVLRSIDRRLANIERHLGLSAEGDAAPGVEPGATGEPDETAP